MRGREGASASSAWAAAFAVACCLLLPFDATAAPSFDERLADVARAIQARDFPAADSLATALLAEAERSFGKDAPEVARVLDRLVDARLGRRVVDDSTVALAQRALAIKERAFAANDPEVAESLLRVGELARVRQDLPAARASLERALPIQENRFGRGACLTANLLGRLARVYSELELDSEAAQLLDSRLGALYSSCAGDSASLAPLHYNLAVAKRNLGDLESAETHYRRVLALAPEHDGNARSVAWSGLGMVFWEDARLADAQEACERAIEIARATAANPASLASYLNNLGRVLVSVGDLEGARLVYGESLDLYRSVYGDEHRGTAQIVANLGDACHELGDLDRALALQTEALGIRERLLGPDSDETATSLDALARVELDLGRPDEALRHATRAAEVRRGVLGDRHFDTALVQLTRARALRASGEAAEAESVMRAALSVFEETRGREHPQWSEAALELARTLATRGAKDEAWALALEAERRSREHARLSASALSERHALRYAATRTAALDLVVALARGRGSADAIGTAWDRVVRARGLVLDEIARRRAASRAAGDTEMRRLEDAYEQASRRLAHLLVRGTDSDKAAIRDAEKERDRAERALARRSARFRDERSALETGFSDAAAALPPRSALVSFVRTGEPPAYVAFVVRAGARQPILRDLGEAADIESLVARWRAEITQVAAAARGAGEEVRARIWDPVVPAVAGAEMVFVVPDGALHRVSFAALPTGSDRFLVDDDMLLHYVSAERDLARRPAAGRRGTGLLAVGGVDFGVVPADRSAAAGFVPLPGTERETEDVVQLWGRAAASRPDMTPAVVLLGARATKSAFLAAARGKRVIHLATHGFFQEDGLVSDRVATRSIGGLGVAPASAPSFVGLASAGLAFSGANQATSARGADDNGILTAEEIAAVDLSATEWVVLSACDTGLGDVQSGEGVLGLRRAFEVSGVGTLVMSLWDVDDEATRRWMESMYRAHLEDGENTASAIRTAMRGTLAWARSAKGTDHPYFWGAFVGVGSWE